VLQQVLAEEGRIAAKKNVTCVSGFPVLKSRIFIRRGWSERELLHLCDATFGTELFPLSLEPVNRRRFLVLCRRRAGQRTVLAARLAMSPDGESDGAAFSPPVRVRTVQFGGEGGVAFPGEAGERS
jgi:hypothetical protein